MKTIRYIILSIILGIALFAQTEKKTDEKKSSFYGYVRTYYVSDLESSSEFVIKHARFGFKGDYNSRVSYKILAEAANFGNLSVSKDEDGNVTNVKTKFSEILLDAFAKIKLSKEFSLTAGQFKIPFSTSSLRTPMSVEFVNRPLISKVNPDLRDVGLMMDYKHASLPFTLSGSVVNGSGQNKSEDDNTTNYSFRGVVEPVNNFEISGNYYSGKISSNEVYIYDFGVNYEFSNLYVDGEYSSRNTSQDLSQDVKSNSFFAYAKYGIPVSSEFFEEVAPAVRYEIYDPSDLLSGDKVNKLTVGLSFYLNKKDYTALKINYENTDYENNELDSVHSLYALIQVSF